MKINEFKTNFINGEFAYFNSHGPKIELVNFKYCFIRL